MQIEGVVKQKEATAAARLKYQKDMFEKKQAIRQRMIDRVSTQSSVLGLYCLSYC